MFRKITKELEQNLSIICKKFRIIAIPGNPSKYDLINSKETVLQEKLRQGQA